MLSKILMTTMLAGAIFLSGDAFAKTTKTHSSVVQDTITVLQGEVMRLEGNVRNLTDHDMMVNTAEGNVLIDFSRWGNFDPRTQFKTGNRITATGVLFNQLDRVPVIEATSVQMKHGGERFVLDGYRGMKFTKVKPGDTLSMSRKIYQPLPNQVRDLDAIAPASGHVKQTEMIESQVETYKTTPRRDFKLRNW